MKTALKIFLIAISLSACNNSGSSDNGTKVDSTRSSGANAASSDPSAGNGSQLVPVDAEMENKKQLTAAIISSKQEINDLKSEVSDSLTKTGLSPQKRSLFSKTIQQLEESSDILNKQLETIMATDLQNSRNKLNGIVKKMKESQQELGSVIAKIDKLTGYLQVATTLIESISPVKSVPAKPNTAKK